MPEDVGYWILDTLFRARDENYINALRDLKQKNCVLRC